MHAKQLIIAINSNSMKKEEKNDKMRFIFSNIFSNDDVIVGRFKMMQVGNAFILKCSLIGRRRWKSSLFSVSCITKSATTIRLIIDFINFKLSKKHAIDLSSFIRVNRIPVKPHPKNSHPLKTIDVVPVQINFSKIFPQNPIECEYACIAVFSSYLLWLKGTLIVLQMLWRLFLNDLMLYNLLFDIKWKCIM